MGNGGSKKSERVVRRKRRRHVKYERSNRRGVPTLYVWSSSAPCRAVLMTIRITNLLVNVVHIDIFNNEHLTKHFQKVSSLKH